jgi:hypothetical protein
MGGTNPTATYGLLDNTTQTATAYKAQIDANSVVSKRIVGRFAPRAQSSPNMTIALDAGNLFDGVTLTEVSAQNTGTITAPSVHPRIDRVVIDNTSGTVSVVTGTEAVSPTAPAIPTGKSPIAQILLQTSTTSITNAIITDERNFSGMSSGGFGAQTSLASASTCDLGTILGRNVLITGTTTITSFGSSASTLSPIYLIEFSGALTLTHNGTSLICPGSANISAASGDSAIVEYLGSGNWRIREYSRANGTPVVGAGIALIKSVTVPSPVSSVDFVNGSGGVVLDSTYRQYIVMYDDIVPATVDDVLWMRTSSNTGSSFDSSSGNYLSSGSYTHAGSTGITGVNGGTTQIVLSDAQSNNGGGFGINSARGVIEFAINQSGKNFLVNNRCAYIDRNGNTFEWHGGGGRYGFPTAPNPVDGIRILFSSGNIASGTFKLYGLK